MCRIQHRGHGGGTLQSDTQLEGGNDSDLFTASGRLSLGGGETAAVGSGKNRVVAFEGRLLPVADALVVRNFQVSGAVTRPGHRVLGASINYLGFVYFFYLIFNLNIYKLSKNCVLNFSRQ